MKIALAQIQPVKGNIAANIELHRKNVELAIAQGAGLIVFPELSLTGYEPELANELAIDKDDNRLDTFQQLSDANRITIATGVPVRYEQGITISLLIFRPGEQRLVYAKKYLHVDEEPFFVPGDNIPSILINDLLVGFSICYELSIPQHIQSACDAGAALYISSSAKTAAGMEKAHQVLGDIAVEKGIPVLIVNAVGPADNFVAAGRSAAWNERGELTGALNESSETLLVYDMHSGVSQQSS